MNISQATSTESNLSNIRDLSTLSADAENHPFLALLPAHLPRWNSESPLGTPVTVTYSFMNSVPDYYDNDARERNNFIPFDRAQKEGARRALSAIARVTRITFTEVDDASKGGEIRFGSANLPSNHGAWAYEPDVNRGGDIWLNNIYSENLNMTEGSYGFATLMHEIGHALGLEHSGDYNADDGGDTDAPYLDALRDSHKYTLMSYSKHGGSDVEVRTLQVYDIGALQYLYGVDRNTRTGNDIYSWNPTTAFVQTIWDAGGTDTIDASNQTSEVNINLLSGSFSSIGPRSGNDYTKATDNLAIADGVAIENAFGGRSHDSITGNNFANNLRGGTGNDTLTGSGGADNFVFDSVWEGVDVVTDFEYAEGDKIKISQSFEASSIDEFVFDSSTGALSFKGARFAILENIIDSDDFSIARDLTIEVRVNFPQGSNFNRDGQSDLILRNRATGDSAVWLMDGTTFASSISLGRVEDLNWGIVGSGDFNQDGQSDLILYDRATGDSAVWLMDGTTFASSISLGRVENLNWGIVGSGDFNQDGQSDLIWHDRATGDSAVWLMDGTTFASSISLGRVEDLNWGIVGSGDFNKDGQSDLLWRNLATGENALWVMNGTALSSSVSFPSAGDRDWEIVV